MEYKTKDIPEIATGQAILSMVEESHKYVEKLNDTYFSDKPYHIEISGNFDRSCPLYELSISTKDSSKGGFGFPIYGQDNNVDLLIHLVEMEEMLKHGKLGTFMLMYSFDEDQQLAKNNFINYILKA